MAPGYANPVDVYYLDGDNKIFLGTADDRAKFARFSTTASLQLKTTRDESVATANDDGKKPEIVLATHVDPEAGLLVLRWINGNYLFVSKLLIFDVPTKSSFDLYCKIHRATRIFRTRREMLGSRLREVLEEYIDKLQRPTFHDFKIANEQLEFDAPLTYLMRSQVVSLHLVTGLAEGEYEKIIEYCAMQGERLLKEMEAIEGEITLGLKGEQARAEEETPFAVNKSVAEETLAAAQSKSEAIQREKAIFPREKVKLGFRKVCAKKSGERMAEKSKPPQTPQVPQGTKVGKVSYAEALKH